MIIKCVIQTIHIAIFIMYYEIYRLGHRIFNLMLQVIQLEIVGQLVGIFLGEQTFKSRLEGSWLIYECNHVIKSGYYYNNIIAYRTLQEVLP